MTNVSKHREALVEDLRSFARAEIAQSGIERDAIEAIADRLQSLAARKDLWSAPDYPDPENDVQQARYLIAEDGGQTFALYLNVMRPGKKIPPHDHTTWACVAAVEGAELNHLYRRMDDGSVSGEAQLEMAREVNILPGTAVAMMPDDIHSVLIEGDEIIRHLHFYGRALETLSERTMYDPDAGTCWTMDIGVKTRVAGQ